MRLSRASLISLALATAGLAIAAYLTWVHYQHDALVCGLGDCETVQTSEYAEIGGIPIALLGMLMFATVIGLIVLRTIRPALDEYASVAIVFLTLASVLYYGYLTWIEVNVLEAICQWCVLSSLMTVGILLNEGWRFARSPQP